MAEFTNYKIVEMKTVTPNLWTILQMKRFLTKPEEGKKDVVMIILIPIDRLIDLFYQSDSFIVILEKKHE